MKNGDINAYKEFLFEKWLHDMALTDDELEAWDDFFPDDDDDDDPYKDDDYYNDVNIFSDPFGDYDDDEVTDDSHN